MLDHRAPVDRELLRQAYGSGRASRPRLMLARLAAEMRGVFTVDDLVASAAARGWTVSTATIYRSVTAMVGSGYLETVGTHEGASLYSRCDADGHHHHVLCTSCGASAWTPCPIDPAALAAVEAAGFTVVGHDVSIYGLCHECGQASPADGCSCDGEA